MGEVTSLVTRPRPVTDGEVATRSWDPLLRPIAWAALVVALILNSAAIGGITGFVLPNTIPLIVGVGCVGASFLLTRDQPLLVPLGAAGLLGLLVLSVLWSQNEPASILWLRSNGVVTLGIVALVLVLPTVETIAVSKAFIRIVLVISVFAVATDPLARIHIDPLGESPPLRGWHAFFVHKNVMAAFLVFALATVIAFDKNRWTRWPSFITIGVLMIMSDSTTGRSAALVLISVRLWLAANKRLTSRSSAAFAISTAALLAVAGVAIGNSLSTIADAAGKDLTFTGRTLIWEATWRAILRYPVLGHGVQGLFSQPYTPETAELLRQVGFKAGHPHNGLLDVAAQLGAVGVVIVVVLVASVFRTSLRMQRRSPDVAAWGMCLISAIVVMSVGESVFLGASVAVLFMLRTITLRESRATPRGLEVKRTR